ncbi:MAG TPA: hypothetical protein VNB22_21010 [Pyrinomonadaceae bacterium]|nr:hypothetical protein [Pyrinomonadaceae bacterium]
MKTKFFTVLLVVFSLCLSAFGQTQAVNVKKNNAAVANNSNFFPLSELKEGLRGTARTVFRGSEAEEFNVEILGIVPGAIGPKQDMIIGRLSGGGADRTAVFAGMSGSPVYVNGKLLGAISYSFPFSKEPICGITPIEQMIQIFEQSQSVKTKVREPRTVSFAELAATNWKPELPRNAVVSSSILSNVSTNSSLAQVAGQTFQPIATPVSFNGISQDVLNMFAPQLLSVGLLPVAGVSGAASMTPMKQPDENTLVGGDSVSMQLSRGDYSLAAAGTVTYRDGEKIYAFGHPFLSLGTSDLPMSESHVVTVIPNLNNSFKLAVPDAMVGSMTQDRATGVFGKLGQAPKMIPVQINLETSRGQTQTLNFEVAKDDFLTPLLLNITIYNSLVANERGIGEATVEMTGQIEIKNQAPVKIETRFGGAQAAQYSALSVALPVNTLLKSNFENLEIGKITINAVSTDGNKSASLERIAVDRTRVKAGDTIEVQAFARTDSGKIFIQKIPVTIPADTPSGALSITVADGTTLQQTSVIQQFVPKDLTELVTMINKNKKFDQLYVQMIRTTNGAIVGVNEMPNLPPSVLATMNNDRTVGGFKPTTQDIVSEQLIAPAEFVISGQQTLAIEVVK